MRKTIMEDLEFNIYEVKLALNNAAEILKMIPETLEHFLECGRRGEEPEYEHLLLLLIAIKGLIPRLRQADEFLDSSLKDFDAKAEAIHKRQQEQLYQHLRELERPLRKREIEVA